MNFSGLIILKFLKITNITTILGYSFLKMEYNYCIEFSSHTLIFVLFFILKIFNH